MSQSDCFDSCCRCCSHPLMLRVQVRRMRNPTQLLSAGWMVLWPTPSTGPCLLLHLLAVMLMGWLHSQQACPGLSLHINHLQVREGMSVRHAAQLVLHAYRVAAPNSLSSCILTSKACLFQPV